MKKEKLNGNYKNKFLNLLNILRNETDEMHPISTQEIQEKLAKLGISIDRRTLSTEMDELDKMGWEVFQTKKGHQYAYYMKNENFNDKELDLLINAVKSCNFLTEEQTKMLVEKLTLHGVKNNDKVSDDKCIFYNVVKNYSYDLFDKIRLLKNSIINKKQISFYYFDFNENGEKIYRKKKKRYVVCPISMVYNEGMYYMLSYSFHYNNVTTYRVDRMDDLTIEDISIENEKALEFLNEYLPLVKGERISANLNEAIENFTKQIFKMYAGGVNHITLHFNKSLINVIYDKFGIYGESKKPFPIAKINEDLYSITIRVQTSPTLWGWIAQFGGQMKVVGPNSCIKEYKEFCKKLIE